MTDTRVAPQDDLGWLRTSLQELSHAEVIATALRLYAELQRTREDAAILIADVVSRQP